MIDQLINTFSHQYNYVNQYLLSSFHNPIYHVSLVGDTDKYEIGS